VTLDIRVAKVEDIDELMRLVASCIERMRMIGIDQWDEVYPDRGTIDADIRSSAAFLAVLANEISGLVVMNEHQEPEYADVPWTTHGRAAVVHRLMVSPKVEGLGVGRALMGFVEKRAIVLGYDCIRLDVFCKNPRAVSFYEGAGYKHAGQVRFRKGFFYCLEKAIAAG